MNTDAVQAARAGLDGWAAERRLTVSELLAILDIPEATHAADPLFAAVPLQQYTDSLPLAEFEEPDWVTLHNDLASYLSDVLIRKYGAAWVVVGDDASPAGFKYLVEAVGRDGERRTVDPYDVVFEEFSFLPIQILRMVANAEVVTGLVALVPDED